MHQELHLAFHYREKQKKNNPRGHSNNVAPVANSIICPCNTVVHVVKVPGFSSTVPPSVTSLPRPSSTDSHVVSNLPGPSSTVAPVVNSLSGPSSTVTSVVNRPFWYLQHCTLFLLLPASLAPLGLFLLSSNTVSLAVNSLPGIYNYVAPVANSFSGNSLALPILLLLFLLTSLPPPPSPVAPVGNSLIGP